MKKGIVWLAAALAVAMALAGCGKKEAASSVQSMDMGESCFLMVTLEGEGADSAQVQVIRQEKNSEKVYEGVETITLSPNADHVYCALLSAGGTYTLQVTGPDGTVAEHLVVFDESQVCSLHISLNEKPSDGTRTLWPATPHNSADPQ